MAWGIYQIYPMECLKYNPVKLFEGGLQWDRTANTQAIYLEVVGDLSEETSSDFLVESLNQGLWYLIIHLHSCLQLMS